MRKLFIRSEVTKVSGSVEGNRFYEPIYFVTYYLVNPVNKKRVKRLDSQIWECIPARKAGQKCFTRFSQMRMKPLF